MYEYETKLLDKGFRYIAGCDEVGRGPLAGPVVCAAVILDPDNPIEGLNDSKQLSESKRETLDAIIKEKALAYAIAYISPKEIDRLNIYQASKKGMLDAVRKLSIEPDYILSDAMPLGQLPHLSIIKGDTLSASIAAASIIAKVERDHYMIELGVKYPQYGFEQHKGYPTKKHIEAIWKYGVFEEYRKSYKPVQDVLNQQIELKI